jgi:hypothetical protein
MRGLGLFLAAILIPVRALAGLNDGGTLVVHDANYAYTNSGTSY